MFGKGKDRSTSLPSPTSSLLLFNQLRKKRQEQYLKESIQAQDGIATPRQNSKDIAQLVQQSEPVKKQQDGTEQNNKDIA